MDKHQKFADELTQYYVKTVSRAEAKALCHKISSEGYRFLNDPREQAFVLKAYKKVYEEVYEPTLKVSKNSWHYRYMVDLLSFDQPKTLCGYWWKLVWALISAPSVALVFIAVALFGLYVGLFFLTLPVSQFFIDGVTNGIRLLSLVLWTFVFLAIIKHYNLFWYRAEVKERKPNIAVEYIKAKKRKICPLIEYE